MYSFREENYKSRKSERNLPSFSSTLLDEIYRSIDEKTEDFKGFKEKPMRRQTKLRENDDAEMASFRRACLVEKWMEKEENEKLAAKMRPPLFSDNDLLFFSSTSSSSDSSGALSSSDTEFFGSSQTRPKVSCFSNRPKPVRTTVSARDNNNNNNENKLNHHENDDLIKSKSRASSIYANLKKLKQPISPGGKLTSFINSLFSNNGGNHVKKSKNVDKNNKGFQDLKSPNTALSSSSACSSASSFSRSCLSKYSPKSREKIRNHNGIQRTVRFHPVSVIVDEDCRPCGHKSLYDGDSEKCRRPPLPPNANLSELKFSKTEKINREVEEVAQIALKGINDFSLFRKAHEDEDEDEDDDDYDRISDSSSDLFELDHLSLFGNNRFCEELPVYETTRLDNNRAIASRLIR